MRASFRYLVRDFGARLMHYSGLTRPSRAAGDCLTIVTFHRVLPTELRAEYVMPHLAVPPNAFLFYCRYFAAHYTCLTLSEALIRWRGGERPGKPFLAITFDDGQWDNYQYARPILAELGLAATFFVTAGCLDKGELIWHDQLAYYVQEMCRKTPSSWTEIARLLKIECAARPPTGAPHLSVKAAKALTGAERSKLIEEIVEMAGGVSWPDWYGMMTWGQVKALAEEGHEIGSHTMTHALLKREYAPDLGEEVMAAKEMISNKVGQSPKVFAYPNGDFDQASIAALRESGFKAAVTTGWGRNEPSCDPYTLLRIEIDFERNLTATGNLSPPLLAWRLSHFCRPGG